MNSKAFRVYNIGTRKVEENLHIRFLEDKPIIVGDGPKWLFDVDVLTKLMNYVPVIAGTNSNDFVGTEESIGAGHSSKETRSSQDYILMPLWNDGLLFDSSSKNASNDEPQHLSDAGKKDDEGVCKESGIDDQERPKNSTQDVNIVGPSIDTEPYMFSLRDNATLEATHADFFGDETKIRRMTKTINEQGFISVVYEGKTYEDLHTSLFACFLSLEEPKRITKALSDLAWVEAMQEELLQFKLQKMDVKSAFLYGRIEEEVYVCQPPRFEDPDCPDKVYKVVKALYGLHQAPRAWYETLAKYLLDNGFHRGKIDQTLFIKKQKGDILLIQVYMSSMGELTFFLGLQVKQKEDGIFISQDKYVANILRTFSFTDVKTASTLMDTEKPLLKDSDGDDVDVHLYRSMIGSLMYLTSSRLDIMFAYSSFDLVAYSDSDCAGASLDRKSTTGGCQFLGCRLISWQCKKQTVVATSSIEAEYVAATSCYRQVLWIQNQMLDYRISKAVWMDLVIPIVEFVRGKSVD
ncbi:putative ribonuclease H-like domain-containing protein [Tanacetum coccineum]